MAYRRLTADELRLVEFLCAGAGWRGESPSEAEELRDGGMGSLKFRGTSGRLLEMAACQFKDVDGIDVVVTLYANPDGFPAELDVWKTDFSSVVRIPQELKLVEAATEPTEPTP